MVDMSVELAGLRLDNPVMAASGTFGYGYEFAEFYDLNLLGSFSFKGTTRDARFGNPTPRIAETPCGMLNAVGLQNPGVDAVVGQELPRLREVFHKPVVANVGGFSVDEFCCVASRFDAEECVGIVELNLSCPNLHKGGVNFGSHETTLRETVRAVRRVVRKPLFVKLSPNVTDIASLAAACEQEGADGVTLINTLLGMRIDTRTRRTVLANGTGGLSGGAIFPVALRCVWQARQACSLPIMGCGGVRTAADVVEMMMAGATAVQVGAENLRNPYACKEIIEALPSEMERLGIERLADIIGTVK